MKKYSQRIAHCEYFSRIQLIADSYQRANSHLE